MGRASDAPVVASAGTQAEPRTPASWLLSADRSQTAAPLPVGSDPRSVRRTEPFHKAPLPSSPALGRYAKGLPCCRNFTPAQPDRPAASMRDFCSGAYNAVSRRAIGTSLVATIRARALSPSGVSHGVVRPPPAPGRTPQASRNGPDIAVTRQPKILMNLGQRDKRNDLYRFGGSKLIRFRHFLLFSAALIVA